MATAYILFLSTYVIIYWFSPKPDKLKYLVKTNKYKVEWWEESDMLVTEIETGERILMKVTDFDLESSDYEIDCEGEMHFLKLKT